MLIESVPTWIIQAGAIIGACMTGLGCVTIVSKVLVRGSLKQYEKHSAEMAIKFAGLESRIDAKLATQDLNMQNMKEGLSEQMSNLQTTVNASSNALTAFGESLTKSVLENTKESGKLHTRVSVCETEIKNLNRFTFINAGQESKAKDKTEQDPND